jgi:hypothetical protein
MTNPYPFSAHSIPMSTETKRANGPTHTSLGRTGPQRAALCSLGQEALGNAHRRTRGLKARPIDFNGRPKPHNACDRKNRAPTARSQASKHISAYQEETAGDDGVRGEGAWPLAPFTATKPSQNAPSSCAAKYCHGPVLPRPRPGAQRIEPRSPSPHRTPAKTPRLPLPCQHLHRNRIEHPLALK